MARVGASRLTPAAPPPPPTAPTPSPASPPGTYRATFVGPNGGRRQEYFDNATDFGTATPLNTTAAADLNSVDGFLSVP